jgi:3-methyladenine DNA glycosylase AlkD
VRSLGRAPFPMTFDQVMTELAAKGSETTKRTLVKHGAKEPFFGVKVADLQVIRKKIKGDQALALKLYATGIGDAQYLAGLVADGRQMTRAQLQTWADTASWGMISGFSVPWVTAEHPEGFAIALKWIESPRESIADAGWKTLGALAATVPNEQLPVKEFSALLDRVAKTMKSASDDVRYAMNGFVIACGTYIAPLGDKAIATARKIGKVEVDMGDTACKVPDAESYILKSRRGAAVAPKRKTMRC